MKVEFTVNGLEFSKVLSKKYSWKEAINLGKGKWRLPKKWELVMLYEEVPESHKDIWLWSASPYDSNSNYAWRINFSHGFDGGFYKTDSYAVRLVREAN